MSIYQQLKDAGAELDSHESDLYAKVSPISTPIILKALSDGTLAKRPPTFKSELDGKLWYDIAFMYEPFWKNHE